MGPADDLLTVASYAVLHLRCSRRDVCSNRCGQHCSAPVQVIHMNSASYTAWEWRWRCLEALAGGEAALAAEARFLAALAADSPKNYQLWNHRRRLAFERGPVHALEVRLCA